MRGGRNMGERGPGTGAGDSGQTPVVTAFTISRTGVPFGSPRNPQQEQIPLHVSGVAGSGWLTWDWCEEEATK
jgi:hypothetical protein